MKATGLSDSDLALVARTVPSSRLEDLLWRANDRYLYRSEFLREPLPEGISADTAYDFLKCARRINRRPLLRTTRGAEVYYTVTSEILEALHRIDMLSGGRVEASLGQLGAERARFAVQALMEESVTANLGSAAAHRSKDVLTRLKQGQAPRDPVEQQVTNCYQALLQFGELASEPFGLGLLHRVQALLTTGIAANDEVAVRLRVHDAPAGPIDSWSKVGAPPPEAISSALELMLGLMDDSGRFEHPLIKAIIMYYWIEDMRPFEVHATCLARVMFHIYLRQHGYVNLELLPIARITLHRRDEFLATSEAAARSQTDLTGFLSFNLQSLIQAIETLQEGVATATARYESLRELLQTDPELNHRQRSILGRALRLPEATFNIGYHQRSYNVSYATARSDLMGLVDKGYMDYSRRGHAYVYAPVANLTSKLGRGEFTKGPLFPQ